jgi:hypothetical protein
MEPVPIIKIPNNFPECTVNNPITIKVTPVTAEIITHFFRSSSDFFRSSSERDIE